MNSFKPWAALAALSLVASAAAHADPLIVVGSDPAESLSGQVSIGAQAISNSAPRILVAVRFDGFGETTGPNAVYRLFWLDANVGIATAGASSVVPSFEIKLIPFEIETTTPPRNIDDLRAFLSQDPIVSELSFLPARVSREVTLGNDLRFTIDAFGMKGALSPSAGPVSLFVSGALDALGFAFQRYVGPSGLASDGAAINLLSVYGGIGVQGAVGTGIAIRLTIAHVEADLNISGGGVPFVLKAWSELAAILRDPESRRELVSVFVRAGIDGDLYPKGGDFAAGSDGHPDVDYSVEGGVRVSF